MATSCTKKTTSGNQGAKIMKNLIGLKIKKFSLGAYHEITIELNDGSKYSANLCTFSDVYCYPKNTTEWSKAATGVGKLVPDFALQ